jgi:UDP-GlcNAc:undecaprenyl-phosphate GlcNAc-1-phosphate transferase
MPGIDNSEHRTHYTQMPITLLVLCTSTAVTMLGCLIAYRIGPRFNALVDNPRTRHHHKQGLPRVGGIALFAGFAVASILAYTQATPNNPDDARRIMGVLIGCTVLLPIGLIDDLKELGWVPQLLGQFLVSTIAVFTTVFIERFTNPLTGNIIELNILPILGPVLTITFTVLWIVGMMNTVNWLDGLDGLAAGVGAIASLLFAIHMYKLGQKPVSLYALAMAGACIGVLPFNFSPARLFLGSTGAMILGYSLATLSILAPARVATALLVMAVPIADTGWQIYDRYRNGKSIFKGDRGHLHFRLIDKGYTQIRIVIGYWLACAFFGVISLFVTSQLVKLVVLLVLISLTISYIARISRQNPIL